MTPESEKKTEWGKLYEYTARYACAICHGCPKGDAMEYMNMYMEKMSDSPTKKEYRKFALQLLKEFSESVRRTDERVKLATDGVGRLRTQAAKGINTRDLLFNLEKVSELLEDI